MKKEKENKKGRAEFLIRINNINVGCMYIDGDTYLVRICIYLQPSGGQRSMRRSINPQFFWNFL